MKIKQLDQKNLTQLFAGAKLLRIPDYQRPYTWGDKQVGEFFEDITSAMERGESEYFLGSLIFVSPADSEYEILDGQQRLTTSIILLAILRDLLKTSDPEISSRIHSQYLVNGEFPRLRTRSEDQSAFRRVFLNNEHCVTESDLSRLPESFLRAVKIFTDEIKNKSEAIPDFAKKLLDYFSNSVYFVVIVTDKLASAYTIFETINTRGTELKAKDLLKNYLFKELDEECRKKTNDTESQNALFQQETEEFRSNWQRAESSGIPLDDALFLHCEACTGLKTRKDLFDEAVSFIRDRHQRPIEFLDDWLRSIDALLSLTSGDLFHSFNPKTRNLIRLLENGKNRLWKSILVAAVRTGYSKEDIEELIYEIERWYALTRIAGFGSSKLRDPSLQIVKFIHERKTIEQIRIYIEQFLTKFRIPERALQSLFGDCYSESWCRYVLAKYEYEITDASIERDIPFNQSVQIEHILPQRMTAPEWTSVFDPETHNKLVNTIGNLALLIGNTKQLKSSKNQKASNKPFAEKLKVYLGFAANDGVSAFHMTSGLANYNEWTPEIIENRAKQIVDMLAKSWNIDEEKIKENEQEYKELFAKDVKTVSFEAGAFTNNELAERLANTLRENSSVIPRLIVLLRVLLNQEKPIKRNDLRDQMYSAGVGDSAGQAGRLMSNVSQTLTRPGNEHLRQVVHFDADVRAGAVKDNFFIPQEYRELVKNVLDSL